MTAVAEYVARGGGLYVVANSVNFEESGRDCPITNVLGRFGYTLKRSGRLPLVAEAEAFGAKRITLDQPKNKMCVLIPLPAESPVLRNVRVVAHEADGGVVALAAEFGKGRVFLASQLAFAADPEREDQRSLIINVMRWVCRSDDPAVPSRVKRAGIRRRNPELKLEEAGLEVLYPAYLEAEAKLLARDFPPIRKAIQDFFQWERSEPISVIAITGGGFTDPKYIGIGVCNVPDEGRRGFLLFEGVNSTATPAPEGLGEAWAVFAGRVLGQRVGAVSADEDNPWAKIERQVLPNDANLDTFDISLNMHEDPLPGAPEAQRNWVQYRKKKCALLLRALYDQHGVEFIRRLFRIHFAQFDTPRTPDFDTWIRELSLAAGMDLTEFFRKHGTTVGDLKLPGTPEGIRQAAEDILLLGKVKAGSGYITGDRQPVIRESPAPGSNAPAGRPGEPVAR